MKTIYLPAGTDYVQFDELADKIASALFPLGDSATDGEMMAYGGACLNLEAELLQAAKSGALPVKDPLTFGPHSFPVGNALQTALVSVNDLRAFLAGRPIAIESEPAQTAATPAPADDVNELRPAYQRTPEYQAKHASAWKNLDLIADIDREIQTWEATSASDIQQLDRKGQKIAALREKRAALHKSVFPGDSQQQTIEPQASTASPAPVVAASASGGMMELDYSVLATPAALLDAFEKWGMKAAWFDELDSHKWLLDARRRKGQGQRGNVIPPMFCPYAVMCGLVNKVRKATRLNPDTAWRTLEHKFPKVHAAFESHDTRERTGD